MPSTKEDHSATPDQITAESNENVSFTSHSAGAQLSAWDSKTFGPMLFSPKGAEYGVGNSPHGGIPICFPWFGAPTHAHDSQIGRIPYLGQDDATAKHGFVRFLPWNLIGTRADDQGDLHVAYEITDRDVPEGTVDVLQPFSAVLRAQLGDTDASISLEVTNTGDSAFYFEEALHTYFRVGDVTEVEVEGLGGQVFIDTTKPEGSPDRLALQRGPITFGEMVDGVFPTEHSPVIVDPSLGRKITIDNSNSGTTIVWNPGPELGKQLSDLTDDEWKQFVCVETANARDASVFLNPGETHTMIANYSVSKLED